MWVCLCVSVSVSVSLCLFCLHACVKIPRMCAHKMLAGSFTPHFELHLLLLNRKEWEALKSSVLEDAAEAEALIQIEELEQAQSRLEEVEEEQRSLISTGPLPLPVLCMHVIVSRGLSSFSRLELVFQSECEMCLFAWCL